MTAGTWLIEIETSSPGVREDQSQRRIENPIAVSYQMHESLLPRADRYLSKHRPTLLQDFLYRKIVASCCRALWCCCSGPCCRKFDFEDEQAVSTDGVSHEAHAQNEAGSPSANNIDLADIMEQGTGVGATAASPPPNSRPLRPDLPGGGLCRARRRPSPGGCKG